MCRIYSDLDHVLIAPVYAGPESDDIVDLKVRPGVDWFLNALSQQHELWLLTAADMTHAENALNLIGPASRQISGILSWEDLSPVAAEIVAIEALRASRRTKEELRKRVRPIAPPGIVFDDFPVGSDLYAIKATAVGIGPPSWIQVEAFEADIPDRKGLWTAYHEYLRRAA